MLFKDFQGLHGYRVGCTVLSEINGAHAWPGRHGEMNETKDVFAAVLARCAERYASLPLEGQGKVGG